MRRNWGCGYRERESTLPWGMTLFSVVDRGCHQERSTATEREFLFRMGLFWWRGRVGVNKAEGTIGEEKNKGISDRGVRGRWRGRERQTQGKTCGMKKYTLQSQPLHQLIQSYVFIIEFNSKQVKDMPHGWGHSAHFKKRKKEAV